MCLTSRAAHTHTHTRGTATMWKTTTATNLSSLCHRTQDTGRGTGRGTGRVEPQKPQNSIRKPLECGNSNAGFALVWPGLAWPVLAWSGPQDVHVFGYTAKPIIFSCYICISKKSNGTNPNSCTKDKHKFKITYVCVCVCVSHTQASLEFALPTHDTVCVCVLGP